MLQYIIDFFRYKRVTHVVFDLDGLLLDSEKIYKEVYTKVCAKHGKTFQPKLFDFQDHVHDECVDKIIQTLELTITKEEFMKECQKEFEVLFPKVQLMPGAQKLLEHLHKKGVPMAVATSSSQEIVTMKMQNHKKISVLFHHITMGSSDPAVTKKKPDPSIFLVCASQFQPNKPKPEKCLVFDDAVNGVKAARAAKMQVVSVPDWRIDLKDLEDATLVLESLNDFKPELFGLPAYP